MTMLESDVLLVALGVVNSEIFIILLEESTWHKCLLCFLFQLRNIGKALTTDELNCLSVQCTFIIKNIV